MKWSATTEIKNLVMAFMMMPLMCLTAIVFWASD